MDDFEYGSSWEDDKDPYDWDADWDEPLEWLDV